VEILYSSFEVPVTAAIIPPSSTTASPPSAVITTTPAGVVPVSVVVLFPGSAPGAPWSDLLLLNIEALIPQQVLFSLPHTTQDILDSILPIKDNKTKVVRGDPHPNNISILAKDLSEVTLSCVPG